MSNDNAGSERIRRLPRIVWCGYRDWSTKILTRIRSAGCAEIAEVCHTPQALDAVMELDPEVNVLVLAGWSWRVPTKIVEQYACIGLHPSDLPNYRGGSPLQHQIIDGLTESRCSLFRLNADYDTGPMLAQAPMSFKGMISEVLDELVRAGSELLIQALQDWPHWEMQCQELSKGFVRARRKPEASRLDRNDFLQKPLRELYNFIRALGDPYPNAFLEDDAGNRLLFKNVAFLERALDNVNEGNKENKA